MSKHVKDIRVETKLRNNLILTKMKEFGIKSVTELCRQMNKRRPKSLARIDRSHVGSLINMKDPARKIDGSWCDLAINLSEFFCCMPEDIFSGGQQHSALTNNRRTAEMNFVQMQQLTARRELSGPEVGLQADELRAAISQMLGLLIPREERILRMRFGIGVERKTHAEIAKLYGVSLVRVGQIEAKALGKLRNKCRTNPATNEKLHGGRRRIKRPGGRGETVSVLIIDPEILDAL